jgi:prepilin-type N-terminal cleavage/methylation domain-containing protein
MKPNLDNQRGDTLVEVLIAITVLGVVVAGCMAIMNRSLVSILNSAERTAVRSEVNSQTELLHYARAKNPAMWENIKKLAFVNNATNIVTANDQCKLTEGSSLSTSKAGSFYITNEADLPTLKNDLKANTHGKNLTARATTGKGIWIDAIYYPAVSGDNNVPYFDFFIKACWTPLGNFPDSQTLTIVRIYDNR